MARCHRAELEKGWLWHANEDAKKKGEKEKGGGGKRRGEGPTLITPSMKAEKNWRIV